jgi:hypothetical protein
MVRAPCRVRERVYSSKLSRSVHACEKIIARLANGELEAMSEVNIDKGAAKCSRNVDHHEMPTCRLCPLFTPPTYELQNYVQSV